LTFLLDTNVISEPRRRTPDAKVMAWLREQDSERFFISVLTVGEIAAGTESLARRDLVASRSLSRWFAGIRREYGDRVLPVTESVAEIWGRLRGRRPLPVVDGLLAATALGHDLILVTRNERDFDGLDVQLLNPWH
jgi:predicted nucleic acid-binding protein